MCFRSWRNMGCIAGASQLEMHLVRLHSSSEVQHAVFGAACVRVARLSDPVAAAASIVSVCACENAAWLQGLLPCGPSRRALAVCAAKTFGGRRPRFELSSPASIITPCFVQEFGLERFSFCLRHSRVGWVAIQSFPAESDLQASVAHRAAAGAVQNCVSSVSRDQVGWSATLSTRALRKKCCQSHRRPHRAGRS